MLWVHDYKLLIPCLFQRTIDQGKFLSWFNTFNSFHNQYWLQNQVVEKHWFELSQVIVIHQLLHSYIRLDNYYYQLS